MRDSKTERPRNSLSGDMASAVRRIANGSNLYDVRTIAMFARLHADAPDIGIPIAVQLALNLNSQIAGDEFRVVGKFALKAHEDGKTEKQSFFSASLHIVAYYRLHSGEKLTQEELQAFASSNGMVHLWPYFRAFVQQSCGQFSIPPIVLAPFRVNGSLQVHIDMDENEVPKPVLGTPLEETSQ